MEGLCKLEKALTINEGTSELTGELQRLYSVKDQCYEEGFGMTDH